MPSAKDTITSLLYRQFCEQGLPIAIQDTQIETIARENGLTVEAVTDALIDLTLLGLLGHGQDYDVKPSLILMHEVGNTTDELVPRNLAVREAVYDKIEAAQQNNLDHIDNTDIYDDPAFAEFERKLIYANIDYMSRVSTFDITLKGKDGFTIYIPPKDWD
jgi:hypothetical protein